MNEFEYSLAEAILFDCACGKLSARQVQAKLRQVGEGWKADLVSNPDSHIVECVSLVDGRIAEVEL